MTTSLDPRKNQLLAALPEPELQRWLPHLEYVDMRLGEVLYEAGSIFNRHHSLDQCPKHAHAMRLPSPWISYCE
jgi:hypothetical protein